MPGTIYRLPDDMQLQRGITYTIMPDGSPAMNRLIVRSQADSHTQNEGRDIVQALQDIIKGKKPVDGRAHYNRRGIVHGGAIHHHGAPHPVAAVVDPGEQLLRPAHQVGGRGIDEM